MPETADQATPAVERLQALLHTYRIAFPDTRLSSKDLQRAQNVVNMLEVDGSDQAQHDPGIEGGGVSQTIG